MLKKVTSKLKKFPVHCDEVANVGCRVTNLKTKGWGHLGKDAPVISHGFGNLRHMYLWKLLGNFEVVTSILWRSY